MELTRAALDRLETIGRRYHAVAHVLRDRALREARAADRRLRDGPGGPLVGIPYGAKDLLAAVGAPTTWGARPYARQVFDYDAAVIERLHAAGGVLAAKLAMVELAGGGAGSLHGPGKNPWNAAHWSGGSSSGTGIAVAAGLTPFGIGSETSGSILTPSAYCGVTGLRPTYGLVSRHGAMALAWTMDKLGPICRSAEDCGLVLEAIAGSDPRDPSSAGRRFRIDSGRRWNPPAVRVGYLPEAFEEGVHPSSRAAVRDALAVLRTLGVRMTRIALPALPVNSIARMVIRSEGSAVFQELIGSGRVSALADPQLRAELQAGLRISAADYLAAMRLRRMLQDAFAQIFASVDVIVAPTTPTPAPRIDRLSDREWRPPARRRVDTPAAPGEREAGATTLIRAGNLAGLPALALPCGFSTTALPLGLQLVGRPWAEDTLIDLGRAYQRVTDWHTRTPPTQR